MLTYSRALLQALLVVTAAVAVVAAGGRERHTFNHGWRFHLGPIAGHIADPSFNDSGWRQVVVPHDFVVEGTFAPSGPRDHGFLSANVAWYRKTFSLPQDWAGSAVWLEFDGVYRDSDVYLNGFFLGHHDSGYTSFRRDLGPAVRFGVGKENVLAVYCDASSAEGWWYEGGGIYRHVWLNKANKVYIPPGGLYAPALVTGTIHAHGQHADEAKVQASIEVTNSGKSPASISVRSSISGAAGHLGETVREQLLVPPASTATTFANFTLKAQDHQGIQLWSPESPVLYTLTSVVLDAESGLALDNVSVRFGIRKVRFDSERGFFLNDRPTKIRGMCNHQDFAGTGVAVPMGLQRFRIQKQKEIGVNGWRMSHNPPNPELLDFLDEIGMLVWDENRNFADNEQYLQDMADMVRRDRNHPSIILWSICNEVGCMEGNPDGEQVAVKFKRVIQRLDPHGQRPMTAAMNAGWGIGISKVLDVQGINYAYPEYDPYHAAHPYQPIIGSETASCTTDRGVYVGRKGYTSAYASLRDRGCVAVGGELKCQATNCLEDWVVPMMGKGFIAGGFAWTGFDYKGEPTPDDWPTVNSHYGAIFDMAGLEKDALYYYKAWWTDIPVVHILPHWNWDAPHPFPGNKGVKVRVYTNAAAVELFRNGALVGVHKVEQYKYASFNISYEPGNLTAVGLDASNKTVAQDTVLTSGAPARLVAEVLWGAEGISSDITNNVALVVVRVVDTNGVLVPTASSSITFRAQGGGAAVVGVGNGDPSCHEADRGSTRSAFAGKAVAVVQVLQPLQKHIGPGAVEEGAEVTVTATSAGLGASAVRIPIKGLRSSSPQVFRDKGGPLTVAFV